MTTLEFQQNVQYDIEHSLDKTGEMNLNYWRGQVKCRISNLPHLIKHTDMRYFNDYLTSVELPKLSIKVTNKKVNGSNNLFYVGESMPLFQSSLTFRVDENLHNYCAIRDLIMSLQEGTTEFDEKVFNQYVIDFIHIDFYNNDSTTKMKVLKTITFNKVFVTDISGIQFKPERNYFEFTVGITYESESKKNITKV